MAFDVIIVVYNESIEDLPVVTQLLNESLVEKIIICDNSDNEINKDYEASDRRILPISMGGNLGLSKAYNIGKNYATASYLCILDDDTSVPINYFSAALRYIKGFSADLFLPVVKSNRMILSPCRKIGPKFFASSSVDWLAFGDISAINSGMIMSRKIYSELRYDENLFLDFVDHDFMDAIRRGGYSVEIMTALVLQQSFSGDVIDYESQRNRFLIYKKDATYYYSKTMRTSVYATFVFAWKQLNALFKYGRFF